MLADDKVDPDFGSGALKITPAHDPHDFAIGKKHSLPVINVLNKDATMNSAAGVKYVNLDRFECRKLLWEDMKRLNLTVKEEQYTTRVPRSQRGGEIIEPMISTQWFVKTQGMAEKAMSAVKEKEITIVPQRFEKIWFNWLEDIHDWCISRQLWWGHK